MQALIQVLHFLGAPISTDPNFAVKPDDWYPVNLTTGMIALTFAYYWHWKHYPVKEVQ